MLQVKDANIWWRSHYNIIYTCNSIVVTCHLKTRKKFYKECKLLILFRYQFFKSACLRRKEGQKLITCPYTATHNISWRFIANSFTFPSLHVKYFFLLLRTKVYKNVPTASHCENTLEQFSDNVLFCVRLSCKFLPRRRLAYATSLTRN